MNLLPPSKSWGQGHSSKSVSRNFLPEELITIVLSLLPVKSVTRLRCVSPSWNSFITHPTFVKLHLSRSSPNDRLTLVYTPDCAEVSFTVISLLEKPPIIVKIPADPYRHLRNTDCFYIIGSCNGLICLFGQCFTAISCQEMWFRCWNPATRTISKKFRYSPDQLFPFTYPPHLVFGYDQSSNTYKVVYLVPKRKYTKVYRFGDNVWRDIQNSPVDHDYAIHLVIVSGTVNWLAISRYSAFRYNCKAITIDQFVIISLDFSTETHTQLRLPGGFNEVPFVAPNLSVLNDSLCFSHDFQQTHFIIWKMMEFGVENSWNQFLKISYQSIEIYDHLNNSSFHMLPVCLSEKSDNILLTNSLETQSILYNLRYNTVGRINKTGWLNGWKYVESLVTFP